MSQQKPEPLGNTPDPADLSAALPADGPNAGLDETVVPAASTPIVATPDPDSEVVAVEAVPVEVVLGYADEAEEEVDMLQEVPAGVGLLTRCAAEAFGAFFLVLAGVGVALYSVYDQIGSLAVGLAFGLAVMAGIVAVGHVSGGHFNPAVTLGAAIAGRTPWRDVLPYWLAQLVGGLAAAAILFLTVPDGLGNLIGKGDGRRGLFSAVSNGFGAHSPLAHLLVDGGVDSDVTFSLVTALLVEVVLTAVFVGIILGSTGRLASTHLSPVAIGLTLTVVILIAMPITNASINPMRSTATAIFADTWALQQLWLFWLAPLLGAAIAGLLYRAFATPQDEEYLVVEEELVEA